MKRSRIVALAALFLCAATRCGGEKGVTVMAAASLEPCFAPLFADRPDARLAYAASGVLARQVEAGAPADVVVFAGEEEAERLAARGLLDASSIATFVENRLVVVAARSLLLPADPRPEDLPRIEAKRIAVADPAVAPLGRYTRDALANAGVLDALEPRLIPVQNARLVWSQVENGTCDLGIVYATDVAPERRKDVVLEFDPALHRPIRYVVACTSDASPAARATYDFLRSERVLGAMTRAGFLAPSQSANAPPVDR